MQNRFQSITPVLIALLLTIPGIIYAVPLLTPGAWTNLTPPGSNPTTVNPFWYIALAPSNRNVIYACQEATGGGHGNIWKSTNRGETWTGLNTGSIPANYGATTTTWIDNPQMPPSAVDPTNPDHLFCNHPGWGGDGKTSGLWESTDGGHNWFHPQGWLDYLATAGSNGDVGRFETDKGDYKHMILSFRYVGGTDGYLESMDGFKTYIFHAKPFAWGGGTHGLHFLHNDGDPNWTQRSHTWLITHENPGFYRTSDGGQNFTVDMGATGRHGGTENIYYGYDGSLYCGGTGKVWRSADNGVTWQGVSIGNGYWPTIYGDGANLYACYGGPVVTAPENDYTNWVEMGSQPGGSGAAMNAYDPVNRILYGAVNDAGVWAYKLIDSASLRIMVAPLATVIGEVPYADTLFAINGTVPLVWSIMSGSLPTGLSLSSSGIISGTTSAANGKYSFTALVTDAAGDSAPAVLELTVNRPRQPENPTNTTKGLSYQYYEGTWSNLPAFASLTPVKTGTCSTFVLTMRNVELNYGVRFTGYIDVPVDGNYTFFTSSDDGSRLFIGSDTVVNNDGTHGTTEKSGTILLKAGKHAITVDFFQGTGGAVLSVSWQRAGSGKTAIPDSVLSYGGITQQIHQSFKSINDRSIPVLSMTAKGVMISAGSSESWMLNLFNLNGVKIASHAGIGSTTLSVIAPDKNKQPIIAVLRTEKTAVAGRILYR